MRPSLPSSAFAVAFVAALGAAVHAAASGPDKALVYCPESIDGVGCSRIVAALSGPDGPFPGGVDRGYDGTSGTVDLATADLSRYAVFIVPSLADDPDATPYELLRNSRVAYTLSTALRGRLVVWSGTPDQGSAYRPEKDQLIRNLAVWASADTANVSTGVVVLEDHSENATERYDWLKGFAGLAVRPDTAAAVYDAVVALTDAARQILNVGGGQLAYPAMASFGLQTPAAGSGAAADARGGSVDGQVVLVTSPKRLATIETDKGDYNPGETVTFTGSGWKPGEVVTLRLHEDAQIHEDHVLTATADASGNIVNDEFKPEDHDIGVTFYVTAVGDASGLVAQARFTDGPFVDLEAWKTLTTPPGWSDKTLNAGDHNYTEGQSIPFRLVLKDRPAGSPWSITIQYDFRDGAKHFFDWLSTFDRNVAAVPCAGRTCTSGPNIFPIPPDLSPAPENVIGQEAGQFTVFNGSITTAGPGYTTATVGGGTVKRLTISGTTAGTPSDPKRDVLILFGGHLARENEWGPANGASSFPGGSGKMYFINFSGGGPDGSLSISRAGIVKQADLSITKTDNPDPVSPGATLTYTITVNNAGPNQATGVTVTDTLPAATTFVSATPSQGGPCTSAPASGTTVVTCPLGTVNAGSSATVTIVVTVSNAASGTLTNIARVSAASPSDPNTANNRVTATTTVLAQADLSITKADSPDPVDAGAPLTYTLTVGNAGPSAATSVTVTDNLPAGVTFQSASGSGWTCSQSGGVVTCSRPSLAPGTTSDITINVTAPSEGGTITNTASVSSSATADPNQANNTDTEQTTVRAVADVKIEKTGPAQVDAGTSFNYTLTVTNLGPSTATEIQVTDQPVGTTVTAVSPSSGGFTCSFNTITNTATCSGGTLANGAQATITLTVKAPDEGGAVTNFATVSAKEFDSNQTNNTSLTVTTTVRAVADVKIEKTGPGQVDAGTSFNYTLTVTNLGPSTATDIQVTDQPVGATVTAVSPSGAGFTCSVNTTTNTATCTGGTLARNAQATITLTVKAPNEGGAVTNFATVNAEEFDSNPSNNTSATVTTTVRAVADLSIAKTDNPDPVTAGATLTYTLTVSNAGPSTAANPTVTDNLPAGVTFQSASGSGWTCNQVGVVVTCTRASLGPGVAPAITITVTPLTCGPITNIAGVSSTTFDPNPANNGDTEQTTVQCLPGKVTGGGQIRVPVGPNGKDFASFGFVAKRVTLNGPVTGQLEYHNHASRLDVHSTGLLMLVVFGNKATFTGSCTKRVDKGNPVPCTFTVWVEDIAEPGRNKDKFTIQVDLGPLEGSMAPGGQPIISGNIQIHKDQTMLAIGGLTAGAGATLYPNGTTFNGVPLSGSQFGMGLDLPESVPVTGQLQVVLLGLTILGQPQLIKVEGEATRGTVHTDGSSTFSGTCRVDMGDGTLPLSGVPFTVTATPGNLLLILGDTPLRAATLTAGSITIR